MPQLASNIRLDDLLAFSRKLIAVPSQNPPGEQYEECVGIIEAELCRLRFDNVRREGLCVLADVGDGEPVLCFSGHYDVVPAQSLEQFEPRVEGANLFGRGSSDMKGGLAAMIHGAAAARDAGLLHHGRIGIVAVPDEETAGLRGSPALVAAGVLGRGAIGMLTPEPTGGVVWHANRGAITLRATVRGKAAHVGRQFEGVNAFEQALSVFERLRALKVEVEQRTTSHAIAPVRARHSILLLGGEVHAGTNFNVTPASCAFTVDRRINPEEDLAVEKGRLLEALSGCEVEVLQEEPATASDPQSPLAQALAREIENVTGKPPSFELCPGLLETRFYAARGVPAYACGPGLLTVSHGPNEFVPVANLTQCALIYARTAAALHSSHGSSDRR